MDLEKSGFRVLEELYHSIHTTVFRAFSIKDQKPVVIKLLRSEHTSAEVISRFHHEYKIHRLASQASQRVIQVYDLIRLDHDWFMVMEDTSAVSLAKSMHQLVDAREILEMALQIVDAVADIHQAGIIHFDICPQNLLTYGAKRKIKISDFGQAICAPLVYQGKRLSADRFQSLPYLAPEQTGWLASPYADFRSDYYSLGVILYQLITGELPDNADSWREGVCFKLTNKKVKPHLIEVGMPQQMWDLIDQLCDVHPDRRPQTIEEIKSRIMSCFSYTESVQVCDERSLIEAHDNTQAIFPSSYIDDGYTSNVLERYWRTFLQGEMQGIGIYGRPRSGKSLLCRSLSKALLESGGLWLEENCQLGFRSSPFKLIRSLLSQIGDYYCQQSPMHADLLSDRIRTELGERAGLILSLAPELRNWLSELSHFDDIAGQDWEIFDLGIALSQFFEIIAQHETRLVIYLDQIHWLDPASLSFLIEFMKSQYSRDVLILCNWAQDADLLATDPILSALKSLGQGFGLISLTPASYKSELPDQSQANQSTSVSHSPNIKSILERASIIGRIFHYSDLLHIVPASERSSLLDKLSSLVKQGYLIPVENVYYSKLWRYELDPNILTSGEACQLFMFASKEQHAAIFNDFLTEEKSADLLVLLSQLYQFSYSNKHDESLFFWAELISITGSESFDPIIRSRYSEILYDCARKAFDLRDYQRCIDYLEKISTWISQGDHDRKIYAAAILIISMAKMNRVSEADLLHDNIQAQLRTSSEKAQFMYIRACLADHMGLWEEGIEAAKIGLQILGEAIPDPGVLIRYLHRRKLSKYKRTVMASGVLGQISMDHAALISVDLRYDLKLRFLSLLHKGRRFDSLEALVISEVSRGTQSNMNCSPYFISSLAAWAHRCGRRDRWIYSAALQAVEASEGDNKRSLYAAKAKLVFAVNVAHWWLGFRQVANYLDQVMDDAASCDDGYLLAEAAHFKLLTEPFDRLAILITKTDRLLRTLQSVKSDSVDAIRIMSRKHKAMAGHTNSLSSFDDETGIESELLGSLQGLGLTYFHLHKSHLLYLAQQFEAAYQEIRIVEKSLSDLKSQVYESEFHLIRGLIVAELLKKSRIESRIAANIIRIDLHHLRAASKLNDWQLPNYHLLKAETSKRPSEAEQHYETSLDEAKKCHSHFSLGLINERFAWCLLRNKKVAMARIVFQDSLYHFEQVGANAKVRLLREELALKGLIDLPFLQGQVRSQQSTSQRRLTGWRQPSKAKQEVLRFHKLIEFATKTPPYERTEVMTRHILEQALVLSGSEKIMMIQKNGGNEDWLVDACILGKQVVEFSSGGIIDFAEHFSRRIFDYAKQTGRAVHFARPDKDPVFSNDPYIVTFDVRSVLCVPYTSNDGSWYALYMEKILSEERYPSDLVDISRSLLSLIHLFQNDEKRQTISTSSLSEGDAHGEGLNKLKTA